MIQEKLKSTKVPTAQPNFTSDQLREMAASVPFWFHSIDLGQGVVTDGYLKPEALASILNSLQLPDLSNKTVLDINAWDGYYSFAAERRSAERVVALDHMMWAMDLGGWNRYWLECKAQNIAPLAFQDTPFWHPDTLPGKIGFDVARNALGSNVEAVIGDFMEMDVNLLGKFDVVLYLGSLYHMENPLAAMRRVSSVTKEVAIIETEAMVIPNQEGRALCEFFPSNELNGDVSNWWAPNEKALVGMCHAVGFKKVEVMVGPTVSETRKSFAAKMRSTVGHALREFSLKKTPPVPDLRYRAIVKAWK